ncbi:hypothetical protein [Gorillibacterium massiliense]|uniref:hypothetical protein n=1 Tax=Gorillibacterium massiliense TaxID=1280390 RepID=UPI001EE1B31A|nr:hypothetical protein [Gorillibacterium massiliense]
MNAKKRISPPRDECVQLVVPPSFDLLPVIPGNSAYKQILIRNPVTGIKRR